MVTFNLQQSLFDDGVVMTAIIFGERIQKEIPSTKGANLEKEKFKLYKNEVRRTLSGMLINNQKAYEAVGAYRENQLIAMNALENNLLHLSKKNDLKSFNGYIKEYIIGFLEVLTPGPGSKRRSSWQAKIALLKEAISQSKL
ncbi:MAG: hypothetical protein GX587_11760 [Bacteroidales bacterium]|nr:hypothetical protein [Bacteroidales bacterium]